MPAKYTCFDVSITDRVALIRFNRPEEFNTFTPEAWVELPAIVRDIDRKLVGTLSIGLIGQAPLVENARVADAIGCGEAA